MHDFQGFPDLRLNTRQQSSDTSLWPSFADIMTVILMIFMLTMIMVIVKNAQLAELLRESRRIQVASEEQLRSNLAAMADLRALSTDLEDRLRTSTMENILLSEELVRLQETLERLTDRERELLADLGVIRTRLAEREDEIALFETRLADLAEESESQIDALTQQIALLLSQLDDKEAALVLLSDEKSDLELALARQRLDFSSLEDKYLKLVRPARSSAGKLVATVQYSQVAGEHLIVFTGIEGEKPVAISRDELYRRLQVLKDRHGDELYVKIVIPDDSGLSYNEAWDFTKDILSRYDYYYIDGW